MHSSIQRSASTCWPFWIPRSSDGMTELSLLACEFACSLDSIVLAIAELLIVSRMHMVNKNVFIFAPVGKWFCKVIIVNLTDPRRLCSYSYEYQGFVRAIALTAPFALTLPAFQACGLILYFCRME